MKIFMGEPSDDGTIEQKVDIQIDPWDTWTLDRTLAQIILPCLEQLRDTTHSFPYEFEDEKEWERGHERWIYVLNQMIWSFQQILKEDVLPSSTDEDFDKIQIGLKLFARHFTDLWD